MGEIIPFTGQQTEEPETVLFKNLPDNVPTFIVTGYTDLRKGVSSLSSLLEDGYHISSRSRMLTFFCGRRADRFRFLMYNGNGFVIGTKVLTSLRLKWPRYGGRDHGQLWYLTPERFSFLMQGIAFDIPDEDNDDVERPDENNGRFTMFMHMIENHLMRDAYVCTGYTDLRKSIPGLSEIIEDRFGLDPRHSVVLFCGRSARKVKTLMYDGNGYLVMTWEFGDRRLHWPRMKDEMWRISPLSAYSLISGEVMDTQFVLEVIHAQSGPEG